MLVYQRVSVFIAFQGVLEWPWLLWIWSAETCPKIWELNQWKMGKINLYQPVAIRKSLKNIWMTKDAHGADERSILRAAAAVTTYPLATVAGFHGLALRLVQRFQWFEWFQCPVAWCLKNDVFWWSLSSCETARWTTKSEGTSTCPVWKVDPS